MLRNVFVYKIQCELSCPKSARNVWGLLRNARQTRDARNVCAVTTEGTVLDVQLHKHHSMSIARRPPYLF